MDVLPTYGIVLIKELSEVFFHCVSTLFKIVIIVKLSIFIQYQICSIFQLLLTQSLLKVSALARNVSFIHIDLRKL